MTTLGSPGLSSHSVSGFSGRKGPKNLETDWDDNPGKPKLVIPIRFGLGDVVGVDDAIATDGVDVVQ